MNMTTLNPTHTTAAPDQLLRRVLQTNMLFSGLSGLLLAVDAGPLSRWLGIPAAWLLVVIGIGLLGFAWQLFQTARQSPIDLRQANAILFMDVAWVVGSALLLFTGWGSFTTVGWWAVLLVADAVALFAILETIGIRRARRSTPGD
ncbi:MAG TPA: hypothetical protein P5121_35240 [Caldilineaceae bacterium]|nr:hypothetical protein [Caldilineaceae bacterium]